MMFQHFSTFLLLILTCSLFDISVVNCVCPNYLSSSAWYEVNGLCYLSSQLAGLPTQKPEESELECWKIHPKLRLACFKTSQQLNAVASQLGHWTEHYIGLSRDGANANRENWTWTNPFYEYSKQIFNPSWSSGEPNNGADGRTLNGLIFTGWNPSLCDMPNYVKKHFLCTFYDFNPKPCSFKNGIHVNRFSSYKLHNPSWNVEPKLSFYVSQKMRCVNRCSLEDCSVVVYNGIERMCYIWTWRSGPLKLSQLINMESSEKSLIVAQISNCPELCKRSQNKIICI